MQLKSQRRTSNWLRMFCLVLLGMSSVGAYAQTDVIIGAGALSATSSNGPTGDFGPIYRSSAASGFDFSIHHHLFTQTELSAIPSGSIITKISWFMTNGAATVANAAKWNIYMKNSSLTSSVAAGATFASVTAGSTLVYGSTSQAIVGPAGGGWVEFTLSTPFTYNGGALEVTLDWDISNVAGSPTTNGFAWKNDLISNRVISYIGAGASTVLNNARTARAQTRFTYIGGFPCSGTPAPGNTVSSSTSPCPGAPITLSLQNSTAGTGVTYQWYDNGGAISGATNSTYTTTLPVANSFYCDVTCSGNTATSTSISLSPGAFINCYCAATAQFTADEEIYNVSIGGTSTPAAYANANGCTTVAPGPGSVLSLYSNFKTLGPVFSAMQGGLTTFEIRQNECDGATYFQNGIAMYIDYNQNGVFTDPGEAVYVQGTTSAATGASPGGDKVIAGTFTVPFSAVLGPTVVRVITSEGVASPAPCVNPSYGEVEDYIIDITANTLCTGAPTPGNTIASSTSVCPSTTASFSLQNNTTGTGVSYQWFSNSAGAIAGATNAFYSQVMTAPDDFWCEVTCSGSGLSGASNPVSVGITSFTNCYCSAASTSAIDEEIFNVTIGGSSTPAAYANANGCTTAAPGPGSVLSLYSNFKTLGPVFSAMQGGLTTFEIRQNECDGATYFSNGIAMYIDYNQNGLFTDPGEDVYVQGATSAATGPSPAGDKVISGTFIVPFTSVLGPTVVRVITSEGVASPLPCANPSYGEVEDYIIDITANVLCSGTPNPGNTIAGATAYCPGTTASFSLQNITNGTGVTYQWYSNSAGAIAGATNAFYSQVITAPDDFWCDVTCSGSGLTGTSNPVSIGVNGFINCYCSTGLGGSCGINAMSSVEVVGTSLNNVTGGCTGPYNAFPASGSTTATYTAGNIYTMNVGVIAGSNTQVAMWLDANQDGIYSASEYTLINGNIVSGGSGSGTFTVPVNALPGNTGMRVRSDWQGTTAWTAADACTNRTWGETEDYIVTIAASTACSGTPNPGNTVASLSSVCAGGTVTLTLQNAATLGGNVTFQWENNGGPIAGATNSFYVATVTAADDFTCNVTCTNSGLSQYSGVASVTLNSFFSCYCASAATSTADEEIGNVTVGGMSNTSACNVAAPGPGSVASLYSNFTTTVAPATITQGNNETFSVSILQCNSGPYNNQFKIYIDYNQNGSYADAGEEVASVSGAGAWTGTGSFVVPLTATTGTTGMRVVDVEGTVPGPCGSYTWGETEDYLVTIVAAVACSGTPNPGNTIASASSVCPNGTVNLSLQNSSTLGGGVTFQWYNNAGPIAGATNPFYTATITAADNFYCDVTCTNSSQTTSSTPVAIGLNGFFSCYCTAGLHVASGPCINEISFNTLLNNTAAAACALPAYTAYPAATTTTTVMHGLSYTVTRIASGVGAWTGFWIDYDHSGTFDLSEYTNISTTATSALSNSATITIPFTALTGQTGMRIRQRTVDMTGSDACTQFGSGETEDYVIDIQAAAACSGTPTPGNTIATGSAVCAGTTVVFSLQNLTTGSGVTYQWYNNAGAVAGATNSTYSLVASIADAYYCEVTCSGQTGNSVPAAITINAPLTCYCAAGATTDGLSTSNEYIGNVSFNTINNTTGSTAGTTPPGYVDYTSISTNVIQGSTYTASVLIPNWFTGDQASVWIDFNQDGILDDVTEQFPLTTGGGNGTTPLSGSITIPPTALTGPTRMRVRGNYTGIMSSCGITSFGEVEDYTVVIDPAVTSTTLNLTAFVQGYWDGTSAMNPALFNQGQANPITDCDSITVELRTASSPTTIAYSTIAVLQTNGTAACVFPSGVASGYYYIAVKGRNMLETWSGDSILITGATAAYNFSTAATQAYGGNMVELTTATLPNGIFAFYSGDIVKDAGEATDLLDLNQLETEINNFSFGYFAEDLNGDGNVDILDSPSLEGNISGFIFSVHP